MTQFREIIANKYMDGQRQPKMFIDLAVEKDFEYKTIRRLYRLPYL